MGLQAGLTTADTDEPLRSDDVVLLSPTLAAERREGRLVFFNASGILYDCPEGDEERVRLGAAILLTSQVDVQVERLAEFLGKDRTTLWRIRQRYEQEGAQGIGFKYEGRPPHKLTGRRLERAQALLDDGGSLRGVAEAVGVTRSRICSSRTPFHGTSRMDHPSTQWKSVTWSWRGRQSSCANVNVSGCTTSPPTVNTQLSRREARSCGSTVRSPHPSNTP